MPVEDRPAPDGKAEPRPAEVPDGGWRARPDAAQAAAYGINTELRQRVSSDIASFLASFDSFLDAGTAEDLDSLLDATDRLMRATARTRIELERIRSLEVRPASGASPAAAFRAASRRRS
ncbi:hypothetical protein [Arenibaculum pallidiluteum]|uniref:hypothetical protein n=1 Tax=Arenibaculum pallidiluteum TaxID=2812559 RepID=UPI001A9620D9|nr:hypothetical protein [Arenibaculum pallidiluteum]